MSNPTFTPPPPEPSYTMIENRDVEAIGAHCQYDYCHQLDFLPFRCDSCKHTFCLDHRSETAHKCARAGEWAQNRRKNDIGISSSTSSLLPSAKPTLQTAQQCSEPKCKTSINTLQNTGVHCPDCNRQYCLKHRFREEHDCKNLVPLGSRPAAAGGNNAERVRVGFARLKTWGRDKQEALRPKPKPTSKAAQVAALNALKRTAKGDEKLAAEKRTYLHVEAEAATTTAKLPKADLYFSADWTVGRVLDEAARRLQVANVNNRVEDEDQRLRIYHVEGGRLLEFSEKLANVAVSGNTIVLLRGVGPASAS